MKLESLPVGLFGAVMGLTGLGLAGRSAAPLFPGVFRAPAYFTELWIALGVLAFIALVPAYVLKIARHPRAVRQEFANPAQFGFFGTLPVSMFLLTAGLVPYARIVAEVIWWSGALLMVCLQLVALNRWLSGSIELGQVNAGWLIVMVGGIVAPGGGLMLGHAEATRFLFGVSTIAALPLMALLAYRAVFGPPLPQPLPPSWFILLVPPSLIYANGVSLYGDRMLEMLYHFDVALAAGLLVYARGFLRWPFGPTWWAFTFPLDAFAFAAVRYAQQHPGGWLWDAVAAVAMALATLFVVVVLARTLHSAALRRA